MINQRAAEPGTLIDRFALHQLAGDASPATVRFRRYYVSRLADRHHDLLAVSTGDLVEFLTCPRWEPVTRRNAQACLRAFYGWAHDEDLLSVNPARRLPPVRLPRPVPRPVPLPVFAAAMLRADQRGRRALLLMRYAGLRRTEAAELRTDDLFVREDGRTALRVRGKGRKIRIVPLHEKVAEALDLVEPGWVFPSTRTTAGHLTANWLGAIVSDLLGPGWTGHTLRHRAASDWYAVGKDIRAVQELLGHSKVSTTQIYTAVDDDAMDRAVFGVA